MGKPGRGDLFAKGGDGRGYLSIGIVSKASEGAGRCGQGEEYKGDEDEERVLSKRKER